MENTQNTTTSDTSQPNTKPKPSPEEIEAREETVTSLCKFIASSFVRSKNQFFLVDHLGAALTQTDVRRIALSRIVKCFPDVLISAELLRDVFQRSLVDAHNDPTQSVPIWNGSTVCAPDTLKPIIEDEDLVTVNTWRRPSYRLANNVKPSFGMFDELLETIFSHAVDRKVCKNWLAWSLQNEAGKPGWALFLYSRRKGTGKSTFCNLCAQLFGEENTITQNSIAKLTGRFNKPLLDNKLIISEELQLKPDSPQGNTLKTYITETVTVSEVKGREVEKVKQCCCFLFTSNHIPLWIEADERRYYVIEVDHSGHASGPDAERFSAFVVEFNQWMSNEQNIAGLYRALMEHKLANDFNAHSLNLSTIETPIMQQIIGNSREVIMVQLEERIAAAKRYAIPLSNLVKMFAEEFKANPNRIRHMMPDLGWRSSSAKWGGVDHDRVIWVHPDYQVSKGRVLGPNGYDEPVSKEEDELEIL